MISDVSVNLVESVDDAAALMRWLGERRGVLAFDTETEGFHWWKMNCRLAQFGDANTAWAIPFERWSGVVEEVFRRYEGRIAGHNIRFDARFMYHHDIDVGLHRLDDTMLMANALWPDERLALKDLAQRRLDAHAADGQAALEEAMTKGGWTWATVPITLPAYWAYGALDTVLTARLADQMQPMLKEQSLEGVYELECAVSNVLFGMETRGANLDVPFCERKYDELLTYSRNLRTWCQDTFGVSPTSAEEVLSRLQGDGVTFTKRTKGGRLALDEDVLSRIEHPLAQTVLYVRKAEKIAGTYFRNFLELHDHGVIHCSVRQVGAKTGRMSITEPALQTLPRDNQVVRNAFIPSPGNKLVSIDYEQIEMRVFAHFAGEEEMIKRITGGVDLHTAVAQIIYNLDHISEAAFKEKGSSYAKLRQITKNANFAKVYGAGAKKFALTAGITEEDGIAFYEQYDATFPGVRRFQRELEGVARQRLLAEGRAYVRAPSGRLHIMDEQSLYKGVNYLVQGTAADVLKEKLVALDACGFTDSLVLPIHDEVIFNFPEERVVELTEYACQVMQDHENFRVPLDVDASPPLDRWEKT